MNEKHVDKGKIPLSKVHPLGGFAAFWQPDLCYVDMDFHGNVRYGVGKRRDTHETDHTGTM